MKLPKQTPNRLSNDNGFTIIEVILFLAITGLMLFGILSGIGNSLSSQRYHESATSLQSILQKQYSDVSSTSNDRSDTTYLNCSAGVVSVGDTSSKKSGQSECVILGKYITYNGDSADNELIIRKVIGQPNSTYSAIGTDDISILSGYNLMPMSPLVETVFPPEKYSIEWGSSLVSAMTSAGSGDTKLKFSILLLKSPSSGVTRTFIDTANVVTDGGVAGMITVGNATKDLKICIKNDDTSAGRISRLGIFIIGNNTVTSGVQLQGGDTSKCNG